MKLFKKKQKRLSKEQEAKIKQALLDPDYQATLNFLNTRMPEIEKIYLKKKSLIDRIKSYLKEKFKK